MDPIEVYFVRIETLVRYGIADVDLDADIWEELIAEYARIMQYLPLHLQPDSLKALVCQGMI